MRPQLGRCDSLDNTGLLPSEDETKLKCNVSRLHRHDVGVERPKRVKDEPDGVREVGTSTLIVKTSREDKVIDVRLHWEEKSLVLRFAGARRSSDNKHAVCVFTGEWRPGDDVQSFVLLSAWSLAYCRFAKAIGLNQANALGCCDEPATSI